MRSPSQTGRASFSNSRRRSHVRLERICAFLRELHPTKTADSVAAETGLAAGAVRKWLEGKSAPSGAAMVLLVSAYGPELLCAVMDHPPTWLTEAGRAEQRSRIEAKIAELSAKLGRPT